MGEITNQALEARRRFTSWPTYQREKDQRGEVRKEKQNAAALERQRPVIEWANRGDQIRKMVDLLYAQYREAARQPGSAAFQSPGEVPRQPDDASLEARLSGTRCTFPIDKRPKEERWIEFREKGMLGIGWGPGPGRTWKVISQTRVEFEPFTSHDWIFVVDFDPTLTKGKIVEGEFKGQTIARSESLVR